VRAEVRIAGVEFQVAAADSFAWQALGAVAAPPFELEFDTSRLEDGVYDLRAVARDRKGGIDASRILRGRRIDNVAPSVSVSEPSAGALVRGEIALSARASDQGSGVTSALFQFSRDGWTWRPVVTRRESAGAVYWDTTKVEDGEYRVRAVVADTAGNLATAEPVAVHVDNTPPVVSIEEPADGADMGGTIRLRASAEDAGSGVIGVRFEWSADGVAWGELATATVAPYSAAWDTTAVVDGSYRLRVVARDRAGNSVFGEPVELTVRNSLVFEERPPAPSPDASPAEAAADEPAEPGPALAPEPVLVSMDAATLWQLERLLELHGADAPDREELEALLFTLRSYARPDGTIPERFWPLIWEAFGDLLEGR
jgi:Bacterial Ig domain